MLQRLLQILLNSHQKRKIIYSRFTHPAKELLELAGSVEKAKEAITTVADWAKSRHLDYSIETVFKKWLELGKLKPKEIIKKPYYDNQPMVWSQTKRKWYVIDDGGEWLEFADKEDKIEWRIENKFNQYFDSDIINCIGMETGFSVRKEKKISPFYFVLGFLICCGKLHNTFSEWAAQIGFLSNKVIILLTG